MSIQIAKPSDFLSPYVKQYWMLESPPRTGNPHIQRIVPTGLMEMTFYLSRRPKVLNDEKELSENALITGQLNGSFDLLVMGGLSMFSVTFHTHGAMMFFDLPMVELFNQNVPLRYVQKDLIEKVESDLYESNSFDDRIRVIEKFLTQQLRKNQKNYERKRILDTISLINFNKGNISIDSLALNACLSRKQYERVFRDSIGTLPKKFLRVVRFQNAIFQKQLNEDTQLTSLAYDCGYFDQSHMVNDFKNLAGETPSQYFTGCAPFSDYFST